MKELPERKLVEMLSVGKEGYKEGFYELLIEECKKGTSLRNIKK